MKADIGPGPTSCSERACQPAQGVAWLSAPRIDNAATPMGRVAAYALAIAAQLAGMGAPWPFAVRRPISFSHEAIRAAEPVFSIGTGHARAPLLFTRFGMTAESPYRRQRAGLVLHSARVLAGSPGRACILNRPWQPARPAGVFVVGGWRSSAPYLRR